MRGLRIALRRRFGPLYELARDKTDLNSVADKFRGAFQPSPRIISYLWVSTVRVESSRIAAISFILYVRGWVNYFHLHNSTRVFVRTALFLGATDAQVPAGATTG